MNLVQAMQAASINDLADRRIGRECQRPQN